VEERVHGSSQMPHVDITDLPYNQLVSVERPVNVDVLTQPYWLQKPKVRERYAVSFKEEIGRAENWADLHAQISLKINGSPMILVRPIVYKYTDPVAGEVHQALSVAPPVTVTFKEKSLVFANGAS